jgi:microcystin-dependent protein
VARVGIPTVVLDRATGSAVASATVTVRIRASNALASVYAAESGGSPIGGSVLTTDANGRVAGWVDRGAYKLTVSGTGIITYDEMFDATPGADGTVDPSWIASTVLPIGLVLPYAGTTAPTSWLLCDGSTVSRTTYALLFATIGTTFGVGDGSTTFGVPDLRGRASVGAGTGSGLTARTRGATMGEESHALSSGEAGVSAHGHADSFAVANAGAINTTGALSDHSHDLNNPPGNPGAAGWAVAFAATSGAHHVPYNDNYAGGSVGNTGGVLSDHAHQLPIHGHTLNGAVTNHAGAAGSAHNNMQPSIVLNQIIKAL